MSVVHGGFAVLFSVMPISFAVCVPEYFFLCFSVDVYGVDKSVVVRHADCRPSVPVGVVFLAL